VWLSRGLGWKIVAGTVRPALCGAIREHFMLDTVSLVANETRWLGCTADKLTRNPLQDNCTQPVAAAAAGTAVGAGAAGDVVVVRHAGSAHTLP
jgi:hypothetical protein